MINKRIQNCFIILLSLFVQIVFSQVEESPNLVGNNILLKSQILEENRIIQIYTPKDYNNDFERSYPVLYVLDAQEYFLHGIAYQDMLYFRDKSPGFIIIGINTDRRKRRVLFNEDSEKFISFLEGELIPFIDSNYRTKKEKERLYFGWEMAGGLGFEVLSKKNHLFSGFILASPSHSTDERMEAVEALKSNSKKSNKFLLITAAPEEHWITQDTTFLSIISKEQSSDCSWRYTVFDREDHYTTPLKSIHEGLSDYFSDYKPIRKRSLQEYDDYGGLEALRLYYKKRGERYDLPKEIHKETKHFLIFNAMNEDNYERFEFYFKEFSDYLTPETRDFWFNRYAQYYLKYNNKPKGLELYNLGLKYHPESIMLLENLADFQVSENDIISAKSNYKKALLIDPELENVKVKLEEIN